MKRHRYKPEFILSALILISMPLWTTGCRINPVTGRQEFRLMTPQQELELGRQHHPSLVMMYDGKYRDDDALVTYLDTIVQRIHAVSHRTDLPVRFTLLNSSVVNAFALPGHVYATRGLLIELQNEAKFASVMAHEMGHVAAGHTAQRMTRQVVTSLGLGLGSIALEDVSGSQGVLMATQAGIVLAELSYSRKQEIQADNLSAYYIALAGWDPAAAVDVQQMLGNLAESEETILDKYLSTHPPASERVQNLQYMIDSENIPSDRVEGDGFFADRWARYTGNIRTVHAAYQKYDAATRALSEHDLEKAESLIARAIALQPDQAPFHRLHGDILLERGRIEQARTSYRYSLERDPGYAHAEIGLGRAALAAGDYRQAERFFQQASEAFPDSLAVRHGLAQARTEQEEDPGTRPR